MSESYKDIEERISIAADAYKSRSKAPITSLAREFDLPYSRLYNRINGRKSRSTRAATNRKLNNEQEAALCTIIEKYDSAGHSLGVKSVPSIANEILVAQDPELSDKVGRGWSGRFLARHPKYFRRKRKPIEFGRAEIREEDIRDCYQRFKAVVEQHAIQQDDIYNFDESGFNIGVGKERWVITLRPNYRNVMPNSANRERVTLIETISASGSYLPPMIIAIGKTWLESWFSNDLPDATLFGLSENGYANDQLMLEYIKHFDMHTKKRTIGTTRLLMFDGYGAHHTKEFINFCDEFNIIPFCLVPHTSHLTQPLDVGLFQPMKHWHSEAVERAARSGCRTFNKTEFFHALHWIRQKTFTKRNILSAWTKSGYFPFNIELIIKQLPRRPITPPDQVLRDTDTKTPHTLRSLTRLADTINQRRDPISPTTQAFLRGGLIQANIATVSMQRLTELYTTRQERSARQGPSRRELQIAKYGVLTAERARRAVIHRTEADEIRFQLSEQRQQRREKLAHSQRNSLIVIQSQGQPSRFQSLQQPPQQPLLDTTSLQQQRQSEHEVIHKDDTQQPPLTSTPQIRFDALLLASQRNRESSLQKFAYRAISSDSPTI